MVANFSEDEARDALIRLAASRPSSTLAAHPTDKAAALALLASWRTEPPVMTEEGWKEFADALDEDRPNRPLFH